jgi:hypothetical protein
VRNHQAADHQDHLRNRKIICGAGSLIAIAISETNDKAEEGAV